MNRLSFMITRAQAADIAALSYAAGDKEERELFQDISIVYDEDGHLFFAVTDGKVMAVRRGTAGEFSGTLQGTKGTGYRMNAQIFAKVLRRVAKGNVHDNRVVLDNGSVTINGVAALSCVPISVLNGSVYKLMREVFTRADVETYDGRLPAFSMNLMSRVTKTSGPRALAYRLEFNPGNNGSVLPQNGAWFFRTPVGNSWRWAGILMATRI